MDRDYTEEELIAEISRCNQIVDGLSNYQPFLTLLEDFKELITSADSGWHLLRKTQEKELDELRACKMAALQVVNILDKYRQDAEAYQGKLDQLRNPELYQTGYVDNE